MKKVLQELQLLVSILLLASFSLPVIAEEPSIAQPNHYRVDGDWYALQVEKYARNAPNIALSYTQKALKYFEIHPDPISNTRVLNESSYAYYFLGDYPKAMEWAKKSQVFAKKYNLSKELARSNVLQGNVLQAIGVYEHALTHYQKAALFYRKNNQSFLLSKVIINLANTYFEAGQYSAALDFYKQAEEVDVNNENKANYFLGYANTFTQQNKIEEAATYFIQAIDEFKKNNDQIGQELSQSGLGWIYLKQKKIKEAIQLFDTALNSARLSGRLFREVNMMYWKSQAMLQLNKPEKALKLANLAVDLAIKLNTKTDQINAYKAKANALEQLSDISGALNLYKLIFSLDIEAKNKQSETQMAVMQSVLNLEKKNHQIDLLSSENTIQELKIKQQQFLTLATIVSLLFLGITAFFFFYRRSQEKLLKEQQHISVRLKELDTLKNQVMANTSHELRTPLNGIIGMTQLLLETSDNLNEEDAEKIEIIEHCGKRLLSLVQDITDISRLQAKKLKIKPTFVDLEKVIKDVYSLLNQLAISKGLEIIINFEKELPFVFADKKRLHQILLNLVGNAIKFSQSGQVEIKTQYDDKGIKISVCDQGSGIPDNKLEQIFEPFEQVDGSATRENEGSGLGLPITKELLLLHKSDLKVNTMLGKGTIFSFILPIAIKN